MRGRIDNGDLVMLREDAFECMDDDCTELKGCELTILFTSPKKMLISEVPQCFVQHVAQC